MKRLDQAGELDLHLKPIIRGDDSDQGEGEAAEDGGGGGKGAGSPTKDLSKVNMDRKACHYRNMV